MLVIGDLAWLLIIPAALLVREPTASAGTAEASSVGEGGELTVPQALRTPVRGDLAHVLRVLRRALRADLPHDHPRT